MFLRDGGRFLYGMVAADRTGIYARDLDSSSNVRLLPLDGVSTLGYSPAGYLLYTRDRVLFARAFDEKRLALTGDSIRIADGVEQSGPDSAAFSVSSNGVLAYWGGAAPGSEQLTWFRRDGTRIATVGTPSPYSHFTVSPDGRRAAVTAYEGGERQIHTAVWLLDLGRGTSTKFTFEWGAGMPVWSPDAARVVFASVREGPPSLHLKPIASPGQDDWLVKGDNQPTDWSADGHTIVYEDLNPKTRFDLWVVSPSGDRKPRPFLATPANETGGRISPDGRWMAYTSDESGRDEIYVTSFPEPHGSTRISTDGRTQAEWRRDGRELFYRTPDRKLMAAPIKAGANFDSGTPQALFELPPEPPAWIQGGVDQRVYAPSADGQRFLIGVPVGEESSAPITVILNWTASLKR
jgi:eukaryotic-like serine/threonine-protein kinase